MIVVKRNIKRKYLLISITLINMLFLLVFFVFENEVLNTLGDTIVNLIFLILVLLLSLTYVAYPSYKITGKLVIGNSYFIINNKEHFNFHNVEKVNVYFSGCKGTGSRLTFDDGSYNRIDFSYKKKWYSFYFFMSNSSAFRSVNKFVSYIKNKKMVRLYFTHRIPNSEKNIFCNFGLKVTSKSNLFHISDVTVIS